MAKIILLLVFISAFIYNYNLKRKVTYYVEKEPIIIGILVFYAVIVLYMAYRYYNNFIGYTLAISTILLVYSIVFFPGIANGKVLIFMGSTPLLKLVELSEIKEIFTDNSKDENSFKIKIRVFGNEFTQTYSKTKKDEILKIINS
ncbi:hypothetical protein [Anaerococcus sp. Marseille-P9784]|uniref:hypothetical protein n=1 Tax=Anaerococcus sp. Marseille-P9784 TaxID=2614127 RepID=UPI00124A6B6B|nr:hypothetical protein [Anaerococcus sp. Marseille-P9784]